MTAGPGQHDRIPESLVDAFLDGELDAANTRRLFEGLRADPGAGEELAKARRLLNRLRHTPVAPDATEQVLARVSRRRGFVPLRLRRMVTAGRAAAAGVLLSGVLGIAVLQRVAPGAVRLAPAPAPVSTFVESGRSEARQVHEATVTVVGHLRERVALPVARCVAKGAACDGAPKPKREPLGRVACGADPLHRDWTWGTGEIVIITGAGDPAWNAAGGLALVEPQRAGMLPLGFFPGGDPIAVGRALAGSHDALLILPSWGEAGAAKGELLDRALRGGAAEWNGSDGR